MKLEQLLFCEGYYRLTPSIDELGKEDKHPTIQEVLDRWVAGNKAYDAEVHGYYTLEELAVVPAGNDLKMDKKSPEYRKLVVSIGDNGVQNPIIVTLGKNGKMKVSEGNHRIAACKTLRDFLYLS